MENHPDRQLVQGHTYSGIFTQDNARVQLGDTYNYGDASNHSHNYYFCASSSQKYLKSLTFCGNGRSSGEGEPLSLKRRRLPNENEYAHTLNKEESLEHVLSKLNKFSKSMQDQRIGKDAKKIARRIALALNAVKQQAGLTKLSTHRDDMDTEHDHDDFDNIGNCLIVAKRVDINTGIRRTRQTKLTRVVRKCDKVTFGQWKISLRTSIREFRNEDGTDVVESLSSLDLDPRSSDASVPITVHFGETTVQSVVSFINPVILAYRTVRNESEVFEVIRNDDLSGLVTLLADGKATVRDCDEHGATLLHYACRHHSPICCQYLIDKGVDIERLALTMWEEVVNLPLTPLLLCSDNMEGRSLSPGTSPEQCGDILLKSGADPTISNGTRLPPVLLSALHRPALFDLMFIEGVGSLDIKNYRYQDRSLLLSTCRYGPKSSTSNLQRLIDAGCDIAEKDDNGWNCLFQSLYLVDDLDTSCELERLQYLLSIFDDIYATDAQGRTIFDLVDNSPDHVFGSYKRDLWYCALERAGIDVSSHLVQHPRVSSYKIFTDCEYTPEHYHALKHLQSWNEGNFRSQIDLLLQEIPLDEDEALEMERLQRRKLEMDFDDDWGFSDDDWYSDDGSDSNDQSDNHDQSEGDGQFESDDGRDNYDRSAHDIT